MGEMDLETQVMTILDFFSRINNEAVGFYIPLYQRIYSWDTGNIKQLMEDICSGIENVPKKKNDILFLGTIIRVEQDKKDINPKDKKALPKNIFQIIDGQQRISTIAILSTIILKKFYKLIDELRDDNDFEDFYTSEIESYLEDIENAFSLDLKKGVPARKPIIIRELEDGWIFDGTDEKHYKSEVSLYLAKFIRWYLGDRKENPPKGSPKINSIIDELEKYLDVIENAHTSSQSIVKFPNAKTITQSELLSIIEDPYYEIVKNIINNENHPNADKWFRIIQLFIFTHYLLKRCCFNVITPTSINSAYDMFQSLNATGTPLTALETFKAMVVKSVDKYRTSSEKDMFQNIDKLFKKAKKADEKSSLTHDFLTAFAYLYNGTKLARKFSFQRDWLNETYKSSDSTTYISIMADLANYMREIREYNAKQTFIHMLYAISDIDQKKLEIASFCILYLHDAGHKMATPILSSFYTYMLTQPEGEFRDIAMQDFVDACKATASFFTLWRAALTNDGLDETYRQFLSNRKESFNIAPKIADLKKHYRDLINEKFEPIDKAESNVKSEWMKKAQKLLRANLVRKVCRFALFIVSQDTVADETHSGFIKIVTPNISNYFQANHWRGNQLKTIEHIAPVKGGNMGWDKNLYIDDNYEMIGNLTLLPQPINSSLGNHSWEIKWLYYQYLSERDIDVKNELMQLAPNWDVLLSNKISDILAQTPHMEYLKSISMVGRDGIWDKNFIERRTENISSILWDRLYLWLEDTSEQNE